MDLAQLHMAVRRLVCDPRTMSNGVDVPMGRDAVSEPEHSAWPALQTLRSQLLRARNSGGSVVVFGAADEWAAPPAASTHASPH